ncbi:MAG: ELWxxDGT repeat protein [Bacteroidota bacterium]
MKKATLLFSLCRLKTLSLLTVLLFYMQTSAQVPQVLKDISGLTTLHSQSTTGYTYKSFNGYLYFVADDGVTGFEIWKTNGTEAGTTLVKDINPGPTGITAVTPPIMVEMNGFLYFNANHPTYGQELWRTDGTEAGTTLVKDAVAGTTGIGPNNLFVINGTIYFTASMSATGVELWKSDGTAAGTVLLKDINPGGLASNPSNFTNVNGVLFFTALLRQTELNYGRVMEPLRVLLW